MKMIREGNEPTCKYPVSVFTNIGIECPIPRKRRGIPKPKISCRKYGKMKGLLIERDVKWVG